MNSIRSHSSLLETPTRPMAAWSRWPAWLFVFCLGCSTPPSAQTSADALGLDDSGQAVVLDGGPSGDVASTDTALSDTVVGDTAAVDAAAVDTAGVDTAAGDVPPADAKGPGALQPDPAPTGAMQPIPGQLSIHQLDLPMGLVPKLGEAAIVIGPDGTLALLDVGNSNHDDEVRAAVIALNTTVLTPKRGYPRQRADREVEWVVLTHNHGDHIGAAAALLEGKGALQITRGVVHRGHVDLGAGANLDRWADLCAALHSAQKGRDFGLCASSSVPACDAKLLSGASPATGCPGLRIGKLDDPSDDATGAPTWLDLGGGARLTLIAANARCTGAGAATGVLTFGHSDSNEENARSLVGLVSFGAFRYHFGGDLTGSGAAGEPDVESLLVTTSGPRFWSAEGVDVVHAHHHARKTSSNVALVAALTPKDGHSRNVVAGINSAYLGSPNSAVVSRFTADGRLGAGRFWVTTSAVGGATTSDAPQLVVVKGEVRLRTFAAGQGYRAQGWGAASKLSLAFASVRSGQVLGSP